MDKKIIQANSTVTPGDSVLEIAYEFLDNFMPLEIEVSNSATLFHDEKSNSF